jgi:hypothetical protein
MSSRESGRWCETRKAARVLLAIERDLPLLLGLAVLPIYVLAAAPTFYWLDSPEFVAAAFGLGIAHPPGHPLASLLSRLFCLLPVGTISFRVALASAVEAAACTALVAAISLRVAARLRPPPVRGGGTRGGERDSDGAGERLGACGERDSDADGGDLLDTALRIAACSSSALVVGLSYPLWFHAIRAEVYALNLLVLLGATALLLAYDESGDRRHLLSCALLVALGLCNHHLLVLLALPALAVFAAARRPRPGARRAVAGVVLAALVGLATLSYLPVRASRSPLADWGHPTTLGRFYWVVSARAFQKAVDKAAREPLSHRVEGAVFGLVGGLGPAACALALGGIYLLLRRRETRRQGALLLGVSLLNLLSPLTVGFDPENPDAHGYLAVAVGHFAPGLAVFLLVVSRALAARGSRAARAAALALACLPAAALPALQLAQNAARCDLHEQHAAEESARAVLERPPGGLVLSSYFETLFNLWALRATADHRPDLALVHRNFLDQEGYLEGLSAREPALLPFARRWRAAGRILLPDLEALARERPVALEADLNVPADVVRALVPAGLVLELDHARSPAAALPAHAAAIEKWVRSLGDLDEPETRRAVTWTHYMLLRFACERGLGDLARLHLAAARALAPLSEELASVARKCGLD